MKKEKVKRKTNRNVTIIIILCLLIFALALIFLIFNKALTGYIILSGGYTGTGYAVPQGFNVTPEYFSLVPTNQIVEVDVNVTKTGGYVYRIGYYYNPKISGWVPFTFPQATVSGSNWIADNASTHLSLNASANLRSGYNYVASYACNKTNGDWVCGCESSAPNAACNEWMLQIYNVSNINNPIMANGVVGSPCVMDSECSGALICLNKACAVRACTNDAQCASGQGCYDGACQIKGDGSLSNPFRIYTCSNLQNITNNLGSNYILAKDINCSDSKNWNGGAGFIPVGSLANPFRGLLNGDGHAINGLYINTSVNYTSI